MAGAKDIRNIEGPLEITSLVGTFGTDGFHIHVSVSDKNGTLIGCHLMGGSIVHTTAEVVIGTIPGRRFSRKLCAKSGWKELSIESDLVIGAVLLPGAKAPILVNREMVASMEKGSGIVDVAIDQEGFVETIRPTTHDQPTYVEEGVIHCGVTNMPGNIPTTSTYALTNITLPYGLTTGK